MAYEKKGGNGGARPGAGRPKLEATKFREELIKAIERNARPLADALVNKGLTGDVPAIKEIADRGLGKAPQALDLSTLGKELKITLVSFNGDHDSENKAP